MKKILFALALITVITGCSLSSQAVSTGNERGYITISTSADTEIVPDTATISFAIKTYDSKSMQKATLQNKEVSDKVYTLLKGMINTSNGDYIKTSDYHATPLYTYSGNKRNLDKYEVSNRITIKTKSLDKLGTMIDKTIDAGATNVDSLSFSVSSYETQCNKLIENATIKAKNRATIAAKVMTTSLDGIRSIDVSCSNNSYNTSRVYMAKGMLANSADMAEQASTNIEAGTVKIQAHVNASFFVK